MRMKTFDWPLTQDIAQAQWEYPYIMSTVNPSPVQQMYAAANIKPPQNVVPNTPVHLQFNAGYPIPATTSVGGIQVPQIGIDAGIAVPKEKYIQERYAGLLGETSKTIRLMILAPVILVAVVAIAIVAVKLSKKK